MSQTLSPEARNTVLQQNRSGRRERFLRGLRTPGGELEVSFEQRADGGFTNVWLSGPAVLVFSGQIN